MSFKVYSASSKNKFYTNAGATQGIEGQTFKIFTGYPSTSAVWDGNSILEIPMTTTILSTPTDTEENVVRYINPAYHESFFQPGPRQTEYDADSFC